MYMYKVFDKISKLDYFKIQMHVKNLCSESAQTFYTAQGCIRKCNKNWVCFQSQFLGKDYSPWIFFRNWTHKIVAQIFYILTLKHFT